MTIVFIPQAMLDEWVDDGKAQLEGEDLFLEGHRLGLSEAVLFQKCVSDDDDPAKLIGRVRGNKELDESGAESYGTSVILGDHAYEVEQGFWAEAETPPEKGEEKKESGPGSDEELLTKFLIENL